MGEPAVTAYWNGWFHLRTDDKAEPDNVLAGNTKYTYTLDLAALEYAGSLSARPDEAFLEEVNKVTGNELIIYIRPVIGGRGLEKLNDEEYRLRPMKLDNLNALRSAPPGPRKPNEPFPDFIKRVKAGRAGQFTLGLKTLEKISVGGECAYLALSIWNEAQDRPLDHLVHSVAIRDEHGTAPQCEGDRKGTKKLRTGLISLLNLTPDMKADAALHIFKLNKHFSAAIYLEQGIPNQGVRTISSFAWVFKDDLGQYLHDPQFLDAFKKSRADHQLKYGQVATYLSEALFGGFQPRDESEADKARMALERLIDRQPEQPRPTVFVRLVDEEGVNLVLPLGLLKVGSTLLGEKATVLLPLIRERYAQPSSCIGAWTFALPDTLEGLSPPALQNLYAEHLSEMGGGAIPPRINAIRKLQCYVEGGAFTGSDECIQQEQIAPESTSQGLVLLAHHAKGKVWFEDHTKYVKYTRIRRKFPQGSIAILSACGTGNLEADPDRMAFLKELNQQGIDAAILSPFEVPMDLGIAFIKHFDRVVLDAYAEMKSKPDQPGPQLAELFKRTITAIRNDQKLNQKLQFVIADPNYEFVLAGNSGLRLCPAMELPK
jgi:hypothetical protein